VESSGNISVFGLTKPDMKNVIIASQTLPVSTLYNSTDNGIFRFNQTSSNPEDITAERNTSFTTTEAIIANNIKAVLNAPFNCSAAEPFNNYSNEYHTQSSFGALALSTYANSLFGHVAATAAIDNDDMIIGYMNNDTETDAALNKALAHALYDLSAEKATYIAKQVIGQDASRAKFEDNESDWQAVEFKSGDIIYMSIRLIEPIVTASNNRQQSVPLSTDHAAIIYVMEITLWDGTGVNPKNGGSSGGGGGSSGELSGGDFILISYNLPPSESAPSYHAFAVGGDEIILEPTVIGTPNSYTISPNLPLGLTINNTSGVISGVPSEFTTLTTYTITATNTFNDIFNTTNITFATVSTEATTVTYLSLEQPDGTLELTTNTTSSFYPTTSDYVIQYSISPLLASLPAGSTLDPVTGELRIVPSETAYPRTPHIINATNGVSTTMLGLYLEIGALVPVTITYPQEGTTITLGTGYDIPPIIPTLEGSPNQFTISPALPTGLFFNTFNGIISGTPTQIRSVQNYTITATNTGTGLSDTSVLTIRTPSGGLID
jgi:hypothetical protein